MNEISPAAREAAEKEVGQWLCVKPGVISGEFVQRAIDAAVAEEQDVTNSAVETMCELENEVARLTKELAEEREKHAATKKRVHGWMRLRDERTARSELSSLRAQLASVTAERDRVVEDRKNSVKGFSVRWDNMEAMNDELRRNALSLEHERDILQRMLSAAELRCKELSAENARCVDFCLGLAMQPMERIKEAFKALKERDSLTKRVAELEKALQRIVNESTPHSSYMNMRSIAKEALSQSPE